MLLNYIILCYFKEAKNANVQPILTIVLARFYSSSEHLKAKVTAQQMS